MDKILKKELGVSKRLKAGVAVGMTVLLVLSFIFCQQLFQKTRNTVKDQAIRSITNISQLNKDAMMRAIQNRQLLMQTIALKFQKRGVDTVDEMLYELKDYEETYECYQMGVIDENKVLHRTNGDVVDVTDMPLTSFIWSKQAQMTESYLPSSNNEYMVNMFSQPIIKNGEIKKVLVSTYFSKNLTERLNINSLGGKGYTYLLNEEGEVVIFPRHYRDSSYTHLMKYINSNSNIIPDASGDSYFSYNSERYYAHFEPLGINDWYLMTCAAESDVFADAHAVLTNSFIGLGVLWLFDVIAVLLMSYALYRSRLRLQNVVYTDKLLGIGNLNALAMYFEKLPREELSQMYLIIFDVDKFKEFNYIHGDDSGDNLLRYITRVFKEEMPECYLFRYESDFFIVLDKAKDEKEIGEHALRVHSRFTRDKAAGVIPPFDNSAGIRKVDLQYPLRWLISDALMARERVKGNHLIHHAFYDEKMRQKRINCMEMESELKNAINNKEFKVYYQPKYDMRTGRIIGAEALSRWKRKDGTLISPGEFIPCFEKSRQIILLDDVMLRSVCEQMKSMERDGLELKPVSINLSRVHLRYPGMLPDIEKVIRETGIRPKMLVFEITESALLEENIPLKSIMDYLHGLGCRVDMDDYGVGASGPNSLAVNNFDVVKMDKSLTDGIGNKCVEDLISATTMLADKWGMEILAEGVETKAQVEKLKELGCNYAQGFYYSRPVTECEYRELLRKEAKAK